MKIRSKSIASPLDIDASTPIGAGGEGEIYLLDNRTAAKVYYDATRQRQEKVLALCGKYSFYRALFEKAAIAFPQYPANDAETDELVGFEMRYLGQLPNCSELGYVPKEGAYRDCQGQRLDDDGAIALVYDLFEVLDNLHRAHIVLGDLNPSNILYNFATRKPAFIDLDSAHIENFGSIAFSEEYLDPRVEDLGKAADGTLKYSASGDQFSMAVIAYELITGANPYFLRYDPPRRVPDNKRQAISLLGYHADRLYLQQKGVNLLADPVNSQILARLDVMAKHDPRLYAFLLDVLVHDVRDTLLSRLPVTDPRHPAYVFHARAAVRTIADVLNDARQRPVVTAEKVIEQPSAGGNLISLNDFKMIVDRLNQEQEQRAVIVLRKEADSINDPSMFKQFVQNLGLDYAVLIGTGGAA